MLTIGIEIVDTQTEITRNIICSYEDIVFLYLKNDDEVSYAVYNKLDELEFAAYVKPEHAGAAIYNIARMKIE